MNAIMMSMAHNDADASMSAKPIVAATDGSEESLRAVEWAAREAALRGAPLRIVSAAELLPRMIGGHAMSDYHAVAPHPPPAPDQALAAATERVAQAAPGLIVDADHLEGSPAEAVSRAGRWPACAPAPTWWCWAGARCTTAPGGSSTRS
jgi:nucleotide-binding universal stress UspA family protein